MRGLICGAAVMVGVAACAASSPPAGGRADAAQPPTTPTLVRVVARDFAFDSGRTVPAGLVAVRLVNEGKAVHMLGVAKLDTTKTVADIYHVLQAGKFPTWVQERGGPGPVSPGDSTTAYLVLEPGVYSMICWWADSTGRFHAMDGMMATLTVTGQNAGAPVEPTPDVYIRETDYHIAMRDTVPAGHHLFRVDNDGPQGHDLAILRVLPGKTEADVDRWLMNPTARDPAAEALGGTVGNERWSHMLFSADLTPGDYLFLCMMPDQTDGKPHFMHGMVTHVHIV